MAAFVMACSAESAPGGASIPLDQFAGEYGRALCTSTLRCSAQARLYGTDVASCVDALTLAGVLRTVGEMPVASLVQLARTGALRYDPAAARACVEALSLLCGGTRRLGTPAPCRRAFVGSVALGGPCAVSAECAGDAWCSTRNERGPVCPGVCTARKALGASCARSAECPAWPSPDTAVACAMETGSTGGERRCLAIRVDAPAALGQRCGSYRTGEQEHVAACAEGLWCSGGVCAAPIAPGASCSGEFDECAGGLCAGPLMAQRCVAASVEGSAGGPCNQSVSGAAAALRLCDVSRGLSCRGGVCAVPAAATEGQRCGNDTVRCATGLACTGLGGTCVTPRPLGAPCSSNAACQSGACDVGTGTCIALACE